MKTTTTLYRGKVIELAIEQVQLPNGRDVELEVVHHPGGAAVVALDAQQRICLLRQYRHVAAGWLWELPAGKRDGGEAPSKTAERELREEAGCKARRWEPLGQMISSPGVFTEVVHLFLAQDLEPGLSAHEADEVMEVHWLPLSEALRWAAEGLITDAKTLVGLYRARDRLGA